MRARAVMKLKERLNKGDVDSEDLPHDVSRELVQQWLYVAKGDDDSEDLPHCISHEMAQQWLYMAQGGVDSDNLPLYISRETMQQINIMHVIMKSLVKKCMRSTAYAVKEVIQPVLCLVTRPAMVLAPASPPMIEDDGYIKYKRKDDAFGKLMDVVFDQFMRYEGWTRYEDLHDDMCELANECVDTWVELGILEVWGEEVRMVHGVRERFAG